MSSPSRKVQRAVSIGREAAAILRVLVERHSYLLLCTPLCQTAVLAELSVKQVRAIPRFLARCWKKLSSNLLASCLLLLLPMELMASIATLTS